MQAVETGVSGETNSQVVGDLLLLAVGRRAVDRKELDGESEGQARQLRMLCWAEAEDIT